jgi:2-keto-4-pentenoate hydratase/2-oxohepta-3-ene-1,7-dioic acid hydratase in catechol pathway
MNCRFLFGNTAHQGQLLGDQVHWNEQTLPLSAVTLLAPVQPSKIVAIGLNYKDHIQEMGHPTPEEPLLFLKAPSSLNHPNEPILMPAWAGRVDYEGELAVVIGKRCRNISPEQARQAIAGYTIANDVTARALQKKDGQWARAKSFDTFTPLGLAVVSDIDPTQLALETRVNGRIVQQSNTAQMVFDAFTLVAFVSQVMTLHPGDVILTGTPGGIGPLQPGDQVTVTIEGLGTLSNPVACDSGETLLE